MQLMQRGARMVTVVAWQRRYVKTWSPDTALYMRLSALIRRESARSHDHCYPDVLAKEEKREEWRICRLHPYVGKNDERRRTRGYGVDSTALVPGYQVPLENT